MNNLLQIITTPFLGMLGLELYRALSRRCEPVFEMLCDPALKDQGPDALCELYREALGDASGWTPEGSFVLKSLSGLIEAKLCFEEGLAHLTIQRHEAYESEALEVLDHEYYALEWALKGNVSAINSLFIVLASKLKEPKTAKLVQLCLLEGVEALECEALLPCYEVLGTFIHKAQRVAVIQDHEHHETFLYDFGRWCNTLHYYLEHGGTLTLVPFWRVADYLPSSTMVQVLERFADI